MRVSDQEGRRSGAHRGWEVFEGGGRSFFGRGKCPRSNEFHRLLVALYCAIPRDYLSDTPLLRAMGFSVSQHGQLGAIPPPPFSERFPLVGEHSRSGGATPSPQNGYLSETCAIPYENKADGCDTPLCDTISKGYCATWRVSRSGPLSTGHGMRL